MEKFETRFWDHDIRIETPRGAREAAAAGAPAREARVYIDDEEVPIEVTEGGYIAHDDMAFKEYGSLEELAEDVVRQRGAARIVRGEAPEKPQQ